MPKSIKSYPMKTLVFTLMFVLTGIITIQGQCYIYLCPETGAWGAMANDGEPPILTEDQLAKGAYEECRKVGGIDCQYYFHYNCKDCWYAMIVGREDNKINWLVYVSDISKSDAEEKVRQEYKNHGGVGYLLADVVTWYVPNW